MPQGWHFVSHTFWSAILVWLTMLGTALAFYGRERLSQPALGAIRQTPESVAEGISVSAR